LHGEEVFERTAEKYADCRTYSDSGRIEDTSGIITFKTFFVRPNLFKFEFTRRAGDHDTSGIIWSDGNEFFSTYNHAFDHVPCDSFSSLFAEIGSAAAAVSYLVPMLLLPDYAGLQALTYAGPYVSVEHTSVTDRSCHRIRSTDVDAPIKADLLIDSLGYKLRRMIIDFSTASSSAADSEVTKDETTESEPIESEIAKSETPESETPGFEATNSKAPEFERAEFEPAARQSNASTLEYKPESTSQLTFVDVFKLKHG
jgi:hypothetical protein